MGQNLNKGILLDDNSKEFKLQKQFNREANSMFLLNNFVAVCGRLLSWSELNVENIGLTS